MAPGNVRFIVRRTLIAIGILSMLIVAAYVWPVRPFLFGMRQVRTIADGRTISICLEDFREKNGNFPSTLASAFPAGQTFRTDGWGNRWVYITDGQGFLLLSLGKDGHPDRTDYVVPRSSGRAVFQRTCGRWNADQIISHQGIHQGCGK